MPTLPARLDRRDPRSGNPDEPQRTDGPLWAGPVRRFDGLAADTPPRSLRARVPVRFNPFLRLVLFVVLVVVLAVGTLLGLTAAGVPVTATTAALVQLGVIVAAYLVLVLLIEGRHPPVELAPRRWRGLPAGLLAGAVAFAVVFAVIWALGGFEVHPGGPVDAGRWWLLVLEAGVVAGISEEIAFRGVLFRIGEEVLGTWAAVVLSGLVFGAVHLTNPDATTWGAVAIALEAGLLFAVLYAASRSLWLVIGFHAAWNVTQGPVLGVVVSGTGTPQGLLRTVPQGSELISGGRFGGEASVVAVALLTLLAVVLAVRLHRRGAVVAPMWTRRRRQRAAIAVESAGESAVESASEGAADGRAVSP